MNQPSSVGPAILYVDDEPKAVKYFNRMFDGEFRVLTAGSARAAEVLLAREGDAIGVLITDQRMPVQTGVQLLVTVKERYPHIVRLLTTAYADLGEAVCAVNRGEIHRYLLKPWDTDALREDLRVALQLHRQRRADQELLTARRATMTALALHLAHELATPLATIASAAGGIERYLPPLVETYRRAASADTAAADIPTPVLGALDAAAGTILDAANRSRILIGLMLMNSGSGAAPGESGQRLSIRSVVDEALAGYPFGPGEPDLIRLRGADFPVLGSTTLLIHVIYNLIKNALDAVHAAGRGRIRLSIVPGSDWNRLYVADTGCGIPPQALPRIFEEFFSLKGVGQGTGMGLPFCRRVLAALGGEIGCRARAGVYTRLELRFPPVPAATIDQDPMPEDPK